MAANRFASMLHRNTNRMAFLLVYTLLEWMLIVLLLLNALFSYLIAKFASFFGLKPPCIFCSRVDHLFEPGEAPRSYRDLLCEDHIGEVFKMEFCSKDRLFSEDDNCDNSAASRSGQQDPATDMLSWSKRCEVEEKDRRCPSCGVVLESSFFDAVPTASATQAEYWDDLESVPMSKSVKEVIKEEEDGILGLVEVQQAIQILPGHRGDKKVSKETKEEGSEKEERQTEESLLTSTRHIVEDASVEILVSSLEIISNGERLIPLELIDTSTTTKHCPRGVDYDDMVLTSDAQTQVFVASRDVTDTRGSNPSFGMLHILERDSCVPVTTEEPCEGVSVEDHCIIPQLGTDVELVLMDNAEVVEEMQAASEGNVKANEDTNCEISIGSEICDQEHIEHAQIDESAAESEPELVADQCTESFIKALDLEPVPDAEPLRRAFGQGKHLTICPVINEVVEEKMPETPTTPNWIEGFPVIPKRLLLERRESGTESLDGSIASDLDNIEPLNMDRLKAVLKAERRALIALYAELEEERSASAIAANQTMAMITRLQEEKAAMQMEALQYQRMMEQQAEYDQEALQLLNELVLKREKEKQDLEKELELHRKRNLMYECREQRKAWSKEMGSRSGDSCGSSFADDCDDLSSEFDEDGLNGCLVEFEEDRVAMLEQLKALEEKLFKLDGEGAACNAESIKHNGVENGNEVNGYHGLSGNETDGRSLNGTSLDFYVNGKLHGERGTESVRGKRLLPLFDAANLENDDEISTMHEVVDQRLPESVSTFAVEHEKLAIAEKLDQIYQRLRALEADRDFLKNCMSSLKRGGKGLNLLQEIVNHIQDLRRGEINTRA